ncbi:putative tubulin-tyrosine ligase family protein [Blattamonas nauphoetae]|uniref:Tubulin-tyrosine ligase family protein n=1 Tax=Blattamonas nauphoetae TaxID=2049346 RepID=A0ABQ9XB31_9EUKA|nr:putative tubulin-tyrosine ligase family protein [Blattamonas nauphoetae]
MTRHYQSPSYSRDDEDYPYIRPCTPQSRKDGKPCVNVQFLRYDIAKYALQYLDFRDCNKPEHCRLTYLDSAPNIEMLARLAPSQMLSRFPHMGRLCTKGSFFQHVNRMRLCYPNSYRFVPRTWVLPQDNADLEEEFALAQPNEKPRTYIVKPSSGTQGVGIYLVQKIEQIHASADQVVVQRYIDRPFLIDGLKFDFRIYVLVSSVSAPPTASRSEAAPLWIWLGREGLARFCTKKYDSNINESNISQAYMHLTNYAVNKTSKNFIANSDAAEDDVGSKRSLSSVTRLLKQKGHDIEAMWEAINGVIVKTMIAISPSLLSSYSTHCSQPVMSPKLSQQKQSVEFAPLPHSQCFHIIGFDIMLDYRLRPWIIEINHSPSFVTDSPLDKKIKFQVVSGAIRLMSILNGKPLEMDRSPNSDHSDSRPNSSPARNTSETTPNRDGIPLTSPDGFFRNIYPLGAEIVNGQTISEFMSTPLVQKSPTPPPRTSSSSESSSRASERRTRPGGMSGSPSLQDVDDMNIFNSAALHEGFFRTASVKSPLGLKIISDVGFYVTPEFKDFFKEYARRTTLHAGDGVSRPTHTSPSPRPSPYRSNSTTSLQPSRSVQNVTIISTRFGQFGRSAGLADGRNVTQADMESLYRDVTRHSGSVGGAQGQRRVGSAGVPARAAAQMGYGEFCHAMMTLAVQREPDLSVYDAMIQLIKTLEINFMQNTKMPTQPQFIIPPLSPPHQEREEGHRVRRSASPGNTQKRTMTSQGRLKSDPKGPTTPSRSGDRRSPVIRQAKRRDDEHGSKGE